MNCLHGLPHFLINVLPWALLFTLPLFIGALLARVIWGGYKKRCLDCEAKQEELRSIYAQRDRDYRNLQKSASEFLNQTN